MRIKRYLVVGGLSAAVAALAPGTGAQGAAPCPPGTEMPTITAQDFEAGTGAVLTATHTIDVEANFSDGLGRDDFQLTAPAGVNVRLQGQSGARVVSDAPGAVPITMTWTEHQSDGTDCTASSGATLQLQTATPLNFGKLSRGLRGEFAKFSAGWAMTAVVRQYTDLRPVELRFRAIARPRLPSPATPFKIVTVALRSLEPGLGNQRYLRGPRWQVTAHTSYAKPTTLFVESRVKTGSIHNHPIGYELQVLQGGRLMLRVREAGKCNLGSCKWRILKVRRAT